MKSRIKKLLLPACLALGLSGSADAERLRFASPLQPLTIPDRSAETASAEEEQPSAAAKSPRQRFLERFQTGLQAEVETRKMLAAKRGSTSETPTGGFASESWADEASASELRRKKMENAIVEKSYDKATAAFDAADAMSSTKSDKPKSNNKYQFVGVIQKAAGASSEEDGNQSEITWYARPKPSNSKWAVRLVHVNRDAIVKDLFTRGKVDIFARYENTGKIDETTRTPIVETQYDVKERSWKNIWNFSPKHFFSDSSGMYWRERRLRPGLYTDGNAVYEASYRYRDGRNGMHKVSNLDQMLSSKAFADAEKERLVQRLASDSPDVVLEDF